MCNLPFVSSLTDLTSNMLLLVFGLLLPQAPLSVLARSGVYAWSAGNTSLLRRQLAYQPEAASCGDGTTCLDACGNGFETCAANTDLVLFCFNPFVGQTCCKNGDGSESKQTNSPFHAVPHLTSPGTCDAGYYCTHDGSGKTWCCEAVSFHSCLKRPIRCHGAYQDE